MEKKGEELFHLLFFASKKSSLTERLEQANYRFSYVLGMFISSLNNDKNGNIVPLIPIMYCLCAVMCLNQEKAPAVQVVNVSFLCSSFANHWCK